MRRIEIEIAETDALRRSRRSRNQIKCRNFQNQVSEFSKFDSSIIQRRWNETVCLFHLNELVVPPAMATDVPYRPAERGTSSQSSFSFPRLRSEERLRNDTLSLDFSLLPNEACR